MKLFAKNSRVSQPNYGNGTVTSSDERYTVIEFDLHGRRVFMTDMVSLAKSDEPAPNRPAKAPRKKAVKAAVDPDAPVKPKAVKTAKTAKAKASAS